MSGNAAKKYFNFTSPRGVSKYPRMDQPYSWSQSLNKSVPDENGQYETFLIISEANAVPLIKTIKEAISTSGITPTNLPYKKEIDKDTQAPTGNVEFKFKAYGKTKDGKLNKVPYFDAKTNKVFDPVITSGSELKINGYVSVAKLGVRLNILQIQILSLVEVESAFEVEEGYEYDGEVVSNDNNNATNETANLDDLDF